MHLHIFRKKTSVFSALTAVAVISLPCPLFAVSLSITNTILDTVGTTTNIPVGSSGTADNTTDWGIGTVGIFEMNAGAFYMRVSATNPTGGVNPANDSLMVARTTNSQGLTDAGTLSVYVRPNPLSNTPWTLDLNFSFFTDSALTIAAPITLLLTSLDIDFNQRYYTSNSTFSSNILAENTLLSAASPISGYTGFTSGGNSEFDDARYAVASVGTGSSFDIRVAHNNVALFMFEFRDPSSVTGLIPEPSSALLALGGLSMFGLRRRRSSAI